MAVAIRGNNQAGQMMTKQEEIRAELERISCRWCEHNSYCKGTDQWEACNVPIRDLQRLSDLGVVIRVEGKLPSVFDSNEDVISALEYKKKLEGYVAVESLIEGGSEKC